MLFNSCIFCLDLVIQRFIPAYLVPRSAEDEYHVARTQLRPLNLRESIVDEQHEIVHDKFCDANTCQVEIILSPEIAPSSQE